MPGFEPQCLCLCKCALGSRAFSILFVSEYTYIFLCADGLIDQMTVLTSTTSITLISYTNQITSTDQASIALTSDEKITMISQITVIARFITIIRERISLLAIIYANKNTALVAGGAPYYNGQASSYINEYIKGTTTSKKPAVPITSTTTTIDSTTVVASIATTTAAKTSTITTTTTTTARVITTTTSSTAIPTTTTTSTTLTYAPTTTPSSITRPGTTEFILVGQILVFFTNFEIQPLALDSTRSKKMIFLSSI